MTGVRCRQYCNTDNRLGQNHNHGQKSAGRFPIESHFLACLAEPARSTATTSIPFRAARGSPRRHHAFSAPSITASLRAA
jgi:hypothetical protein